MNLKSGLARVSKFTNPKQSNMGYHTVALENGILKATEGYVGCSIPTEGIDDFDIAVESALLHKILTKVDSPKLKIVKATKKVKNRALVVSGGNSTFKLPEFPAVKVPKHPKEPEWDDATEISSGTIALIEGISPIASRETGNMIGGIAGIRVNPTWIAAANHQSVIKLDIAGIVEKGITVPPFFFSGFDEDAVMVVTKDHVWLKGVETGQIRWCRPLLGVWPEAAVDKTLTSSFERAAQVGWEYSVGSADLIDTCKRAETVRGSDTDYLLKIVAPTSVVIETTPGTKTEFTETINAEEIGGNQDGDPNAVGIVPKNFAVIVEAVANAQPGKTMTLSVTESLQPILFSQGSAQGLVMPVRI